MTSLLVYSHFEPVMKRYFTLTFIAYLLSIFSAFALDTDNDKVLDQYDLSPQQKAKSFAKTDAYLVQLSGVYSDSIASGRYRYGDEVIISGNQLSNLANPIIVIYQHNNIFNFLPITNTLDGLSFKLDVPKSKYSLFIYDNDQKTNELKLEPFAANTPLIFGETSVTLEKGKSVSLAGIGFNKDSKVVLGSLKIVPKSFSNTRLVFDVPYNAAGLQLYIENNELKGNIIKVSY